MREAIAALILVAGLAATTVAQGAVITDVQSSFDKDDPFDMKLTVGYDFNYHHALITRETIKDSKIELANKLEFERMWHVIHFGVAIGLYQDLEFVLDLPFIASDQTEVNAHPDLKNDVKCSGTALYSACLADIDPSPMPWNLDSATMAGTLFDLPFTGKGRSGLGDIGLGDIGLGLRWAPWHYQRDRQYPSWLLALVLRLPTAAVKEAGNNAVGEGLFQLEFNTAISRRVTSFFEPYFDLHGKLRFPTEKSLFKKLEASQTLVQPGHQMGLKLGMEFIPWEVAAEERHVSIEIGGGLDYVFEGREYSELWEALGMSPCETRNDCESTTYTGVMKGMEKDDKAKLDELKAENQSAGQGLPRTDGITDIEHYSLFSFWAGLDIQPIKYFQMNLRFNLAYTTPHFITAADAGRDSLKDTDFVVTGKNSLGENEYNPKYLEEMDEVGHRFRTSSSLLYGFMINMAGRF